ncbi:MAG: epoxyqueuosine reductase [Chloroflexi bacterium]|nr:epoxyqueuosine reductase [Chloroflexota bacterium]
MGLNQLSISSRLEEIRRESSLDLLGVADAGRAAQDCLELTGPISERFPRAIVVAVRVSPGVLGTLVDGPNLLYLHHYRHLNFQLDRGALRIAQEIERMGHAAVPIAASQVVDWTAMRGHVSHKEMAGLAGLGWRGRNNLLVTGQFGAQVRLASVLTDLPLEPGAPLSAGCQGCQRCLAACPAGAIRGEPEEFDHQLCYGQLKEFSKTRRISQYICGLCVKACSGPLQDGAGPISVS